MFVIKDTDKLSDFHMALTNALSGIQFTQDKEKDNSLPYWHIDPRPTDRYIKNLRPWEIQSFWCSAFQSKLHQNMFFLVYKPIAPFL